MPIKARTTKAEIDRYIDGRVEALKNAVVYNLHYVGEQVLNAARSRATYKDQTGNLRSSTGYVIAIDGRVVEMSSFEVVKNGQEGSKSGKEYVLQTLGDFPRGIVLIVVAGKNYAQYVSDRGYPVLDTAELLARKLVPQMLKKLGFK